MSSTPSGGREFSAAQGGELTLPDECREALRRNSLIVAHLDPNGTMTPVGGGFAIGGTARGFIGMTACHVFAELVRREGSPHLRHGVFAQQLEDIPHAPALDEGRFRAFFAVPSGWVHGAIRWCVTSRDLDIAVFFCEHSEGWGSYMMAIPISIDIPPVGSRVIISTLRDISIGRNDRGKRLVQAIPADLWGGVISHKSRGVFNKGPCMELSLPSDLQMSGSAVVRAPVSPGPRFLDDLVVCGMICSSSYFDATKPVWSENAECLVTTFAPLLFPALALNLPGGIPIQGQQRTEWDLMSLAEFDLIRLVGDLGAIARVRLPDGQCIVTSRKWDALNVRIE